MEHQMTDYAKTAHDKNELAVASIGVVLIALSAFALWLCAWNSGVGQIWKVAYCIWAIIVPIAFFIHYWIFGIWRPVSEGHIDHMRHLQQLGLSVWVGIAAVFAVLYF
jgi:hypothetical protein